MRFAPDPHSADPGVPTRFVSESGAWFVGLGPVLYGVRVRAGRTEDGWYAVDLCGGADQFFTAQLLASVTTVLEALPESASPYAVQRLFPEYRVRPLHKDVAFRAGMRELLHTPPEILRARVQGDLLSERT